MNNISHTFKLLVLNTFVVGMLSSCGGDKKDDKKDEESMEMTREQLNLNYVDTLVLNKSTFSQQVICNGKLRAIAKSELAMPLSGVLRKINVRNGSLVTKGAILAEIDKEEANIELGKAQRQMEKATVDFIDKLIDLGYDEDTTQIPKPILKQAQITSGYTSAEDALDEAKRRLHNSNLHAPFSGRVANMDSKLHQSSTDKFCTLIDDTYFDVEFNILEAEMGVGRVGQRVVVSPFIDEYKKFEGEVSEVNPVIDEKGQIKIRAKIKNKDGYLVEGMNVRVVIESDVENMYVVPKDAVVQRDGFYVVFRYEGGVAVWTYVDVMHSNIDSYAITGNKVKQTNINTGDVIITSGNLNLADGTEVLPRKKE